jgi:hypothetical protein
VIGKGWQMAKHLSAGDRLPGARFTSILEKVEQGSELEAYNLIVGDFHTYFVGDSKLLLISALEMNPTLTKSTQ